MKRLTQLVSLFAAALIALGMLGGCASGSMSSDASDDGFDPELEQGEKNSDLERGVAQTRQDLMSAWSQLDQRFNMFEDQVEQGGEKFQADAREDLDAFAQRLEATGERLRNLGADKQTPKEQQAVQQLKMEVSELEREFNQLESKLGEDVEVEVDAEADEEPLDDSEFQVDE